MAETTDEFVNVPTSKRYVLAVYHFLGTLEQEGTSGSVPREKSETAGEKNRDQWWSGTDPVARLTRLKSASPSETALTLLNLTASQPTRWVSFEQVSREAGRSSDQARADLSVFTVLIKQLFPTNAGGWWPVHIKDGTPVQYRMSEEIARLWKSS